MMSMKGIQKGISPAWSKMQENPITKCRIEHKRHYKDQIQNKTAVCSKMKELLTLGNRINGLRICSSYTEEFLSTNKQRD